MVLHRTSCRLQYPKIHWSTMTCWLYTIQLLSVQCSKEQTFTVGQQLMLVSEASHCSTLVYMCRCTAECEDGYQGFAFTLCPVSGKWAAPANLCKKPSEPITCRGSPSNIPGVRWNPCDGFPQGSTCTAPCTFGSTGVGYTSVCGADGTWQKTVVQCTDVLCQGSPQATPGVNWPDCTGHIVGESCVVSGCAGGFKGTGAISNCMPDGTWYDIWTDCVAR